jgi:DNA-binding SARP family transcriptional activator
MSEQGRKVARGALGRAEGSKVVPLDLAAGRQPPRQPVVRIHLLGSLRAVTHLGENVLPRSKKARAVLGYLCVHAGENVSRGRLASLLWDRVPDHQARNSLRQALWELSTAMGPMAASLISGDRDSVKLEPGICWIDAAAMLSLDSLPPRGLQGQASAISASELLEDLDGVSPPFDHWLLAERTRFTERVRRQFESNLAQLDRPEVDAELRVAAARRFIAFDPTHEGASRALMRALVDKGERAQALREYERCRAALRARLDVEPSSETRALYEALRTFGARGRDPIVALKRTPSHADHNIPVSTACNRLRIGVLPFETGPGALLRNERLAFSLSQEISTALARFRWFDVIAPPSAAGKPAQAGRRLLRRKQLHYLVDGKVSGSEDKVHISARLLDVGQDASPVWSDRFELENGSIDRIDELAVALIAARIDPVILFIEGQPKRLRNSGATGLVLRAISLMYDLERDTYDEAGRLLNQALEIDPENGKAAAWGAYWQVFNVGQGWSNDPAAAVQTAQQLALRAIKIDPDNAESIGIYAHICAFLEKDFDSAVHYFERALRLNPNLGFIWGLSAPTYCYIGRPDTALRHLDRYRELTPYDPYFRYWESAYTIAHTFRGDYESAATIGRRAVRANPEFSNGYKPFIAALGHLGRREEAAPYVEKLLSLEPLFTVEHFGKVYPFQRPEDRERYMQGLRLAGVPET